MTSDVVLLDEDGGFSLSAKILAETGWEPGDQLTVEVVGNELHMFSVKQAIRNAQEEVTRPVPAGVSLVEELIRERRAEIAREEPTFYLCRSGPRIPAEDSGSNQDHCHHPDPRQAGQLPNQRFTGFDFAHVAAGEDEARLRSIHALDDGSDAYIAARLPADAIFPVLAHIGEDAAGRGGSLAIQLRLRSQWPALIVVSNQEGREAVGQIDRASGNGLRGRDALFEAGSQIVGHCDLRIVRAQSKHLLGNGIKRKRETGGEAGENQCVAQQSGA